MTHVPSHEIVSYLRACLPDMVTLVQQLAAIESPSTVPESHGLLFTRLSEICERFSYTTRHIPGQQSGGHFFAQPQNRRHQQPVQILLGHSDTVWPLGTLKEMPVEVGEDIIRGPGVYDMKGGLVQMLYALQALHVLQLQPTVTPLVFINSDEEIGSRESTPHIRRLARIADRAFVLEPSLGLGGKLKIARKGVGSFSIVAKGKAAHAGLNPEGGASAILELSFVIQKLFALNDASRGISVNVGMIDGGLRPNVVAPESRAHIDVRVQTREDAKRVEERIHSLQPTTPGVTLEITGSVRRQPMEQTPPNLALLQIAKEIGQSIALDVDAGAAGGASDGNTTSLFTATLDGLGAVGDGAHAHHEFIYFDKLVERSALLALLLMTPPVRPSSE